MTGGRRRHEASRSGSSCRETRRTSSVPRKTVLSGPVHPRRASQPPAGSGRSTGIARSRTRLIPSLAKHAAQCRLHRDAHSASAPAADLARGAGCGTPGTWPRTRSPGGGRPRPACPACSIQPPWPCSGRARMIRTRSAIGERFLLVVGHVERGHAHPLEDGAQLVHQLLAQRAVQRAERLVEHQQARAAAPGCGPGRRAAARRPTARSRGAARSPAAPPAPASPAPAPRSAPGTAPCMRRPNATFWADVLVGEERVILEHEAEVAPVDGHVATGPARRRSPCPCRASPGRRRCAAAWSCRSRSAPAGRRSRPDRPLKLASSSTGRPG